MLKDKHDITVEYMEVEEEVEEEKNHKQLTEMSFDAFQIYYFAQSSGWIQKCIGSNVVRK